MRGESRVGGSSDPYLELLAEKLSGCRETHAQDVPGDVVTMNSQVRLREVDSGREFDYMLVFPADADVRGNRISVLTPMGVALLGARVGSLVEVRTPSKLRRMSVVELIFQPEATGRVDL